MADEFRVLVDALQRTPAAPELRARALRYVVASRSRMMDLATSKAEYGSEYAARHRQCRELIARLGDDVPPAIRAEFADPW